MWIAPRRSALLLTCSALSMCICLFRIRARRKDEFFYPATLGPLGGVCIVQLGETENETACSLVLLHQKGKQLCGAVRCCPTTSMHHCRDGQQSCWLCSKASSKLLCLFLSPPCPQKEKKPPANTITPALEHFLANSL